MPKLWVEAIEAHRRTVRDAILDTTAALVARHGLASVGMSRIAEDAGVGRATLYKYFPDVEAILVAWHERHVMGHLDRLIEVRDRSADGKQLEAVLEAYALITHERSRHGAGDDHAHARHGEHALHEHHSTEVSALVHRTEHVARVQQRLSDFLRDVLVNAAERGEVRADIRPDELASYCLHALAAAASLPTKTAVGRLVAVTLDGLRPDR